MDPRVTVISPYLKRSMDAIDNQLRYRPVLMSSRQFHKVHCVSRENWFTTIAGCKTHKSIHISCTNYITFMVTFLAQHAELFT